MKQRIPTFENFQYDFDSVLNELSENSTLYHRSYKKYNVGDIISPGRDDKGTHWSKKNVVEILLEEYRKQNFPNRPSRADAVYSSVIPRSRFVDKGNLYVVKVIGNYFMTDSMLIDALGEELYQNTKERQFLTPSDVKDNPSNFMWALDRWSAKKYWEGVKSLPKNRWGDLEILSEQVQVTQVIEDSPDRLVPGMDVTVTEDNKLKVQLNIYNNEDKSGKRKTLHVDEMKKLIKYIETKIIDCKVKVASYDKNVYEFTGFLRKGAKLQLSYVRSSNTKNIHNLWDDEKPKEKYSTIMFNFYVGKKLYKREDDAPGFRFATYTDSGSPIYDLGLYLKK